MQCLWQDNGTAWNSTSASSSSSQLSALPFLFPRLTVHSSMLRQVWNTWVLPFMVMAVRTMRLTGALHLPGLILTSWRKHGRTPHSPGGRSSISMGAWSVKASLLNGFSRVDYSTKAQVRWLPEPVPTQDHWSPALLCFPGVQRHGARSRLLHASHGPAAQKAFAATWQGLTVT